MENEEISIEESNQENIQNAADTASSSSGTEVLGKVPSKKKERLSEDLDHFFKELEKINEVEGKIEFTIAFMEKAIAKEQAADFKVFWEARMKCLELFKDNMPPFVRATLWGKFSELSKQARRLKDMLDEQSDFAAEQIDIAINAIENGLDQIPEMLTKEEDISLSPDAHALKKHFTLYNTAQRELSHLNLFASRITSLRKELIKTEMRVRTKNKFFDRLSKAGDRVFPRRKTLIQDISDAFSQDITQFIQDHFSNNESRISIFDLREEIKALQSAAKLFTLNAQAFSKTRLDLSECWDKLKEKDKERKADLDKRKEFFKKNREELKLEIEASSLKFTANEISCHESLEFLDEMVSQMRQRDLGRDELKELRELIANYRSQIQEKQKIQEEERLKNEEAREAKKRELMELFVDKCKNFLIAAKEISAEDVQIQKETLMQEIEKSALSKFEKKELEKALKPLKDILREKREQALLALPADERLALEQLKELLLQKREERQEIKERIENYRKLLGSSGLSFEKSLEYNARFAEEKESYEKAQSSVRGIEKKIAELS